MKRVLSWTVPVLTLRVVVPRKAALLKLVQRGERHQCPRRPSPSRAQAHRHVHPRHHRQPRCCGCRLQRCGATWRRSRPQRARLPKRRTASLWKAPISCRRPPQRRRSGCSLRLKPRCTTAALISSAPLRRCWHAASGSCRPAARVQAVRRLVTAILQPVRSAPAQHLLLSLPQPLFLSLSLRPRQATLRQ